MLKRKPNKFVLFLMSYLGLTDRELSHHTLHVLIGVTWEELIFFGLPLVPLVIVGGMLFRIFPNVNQWLLLSIWFIAFFLWTSFLTYVFVVFHQPGHFYTEFKLRAAKRLLRQMETAWLWQNHHQAQKLATDLLGLANELWELSGSDYSNFLRFISLYVLCYQNANMSPTDNKISLLKRLEDAVEIYPNEILS